MDDTLLILKNNPLFSGLSEEEISSALPCLCAKTLRKSKHEFLLHSGEITKEMGILLSGRAIVLQEDIWGNRNILSKLQEGDCFAEPFAASKGTPINVSIVANTDVIYLMLPVERLLKVCNHACRFHSQIICNLVSIMSEKVLLYNNKITHMSKRTTREKLLSYLSAESQKKKSLSFTIPFNRQELADFLCVERAAMSVVLSELKKEGFLDFHKNYFTLYR